MSDLRPDFGNVGAEYEAARAGTGFVTGAGEVVWASGADTISYLDGQLSQDVTAMEPGSVARSFLLEPRGKLVATLWVLRGSDSVGLVVDRGLGAAVVDRLESFKFRVEVDLRRDPRPVHELWGTEAVLTAARAGVEPGAGWTDHGGTISARLTGGLDRVLVLGDDGPLLDVGAIRIGAVAWTSVRIEAGEPVMGVDLDDSTIPQESGLVPDSVSFTKGCFVGQELVARIDSRGRVNRRLVGLLVQTNALPPVSAAVLDAGEERGTVTSVGESLTLRSPVAMAMVRREIEDGDTVEIAWETGAAPALVWPLPLVDFSADPHTLRTLPSQTDQDLAGA